MAPYYHMPHQPYQLYLRGDPELPAKWRLEYEPQEYTRGKQDSKLCILKTNTDLKPTPRNFAQ